jgi:hypothetical protein
MNDRDMPLDVIVCVVSPALTVPGQVEPASREPLAPELPPDELLPPEPLAPEPLAEVTPLEPVEPEPLALELPDAEPPEPEAPEPEPPELELLKRGPPPLEPIVPPLRPPSLPPVDWEPHAVSKNRRLPRSAPFSDAACGLFALITDLRASALRADAGDDDGRAAGCPEAEVF